MGWACSCGRKRMKEKKIIADLLKMVKDNEWLTHHASENNYCPYCNRDDEFWTYQTRHHKGCKFVTIVKRAEKILANKGE